MPIQNYKWLEVMPGRRRGKPTIKGTRITVDDILEALANGWDINEVAENFRIPTEAIHEALKYALDALKKLRILIVESSGRWEYSVATRKGTKEKKY